MESLIGLAKIGQRKLMIYIAFFAHRKELILVLKQRIAKEDRKAFRSTRLGATNSQKLNDRTPPGLAAISKKKLSVIKVEIAQSS